jgi:hypothetical protein
MRYMELRVKTGLCKLILNVEIPQTSCDYYQAPTFNKDFLSVLKPYGIKVLFPII